MKKILLLLIMVSKLSGSFIDDLEKAIIATDLPSVQMLLARDESISEESRIQLISLATSVLQKREDLRNVCEMEGWVKCAEVRNGLVNMLKERNSYGIKSLLFFMLAFFGCCWIDLDRMIEQRPKLLLTIFSGCLLASFYNLYKYIKTENELTIKCQNRCDELWTAALKIRQMLYKIVPAKSEASPKMKSDNI